MADLSRLPGFLAHASRTGFAYGRFDCLLWLADWATLNGWPDPGARWRGRYSAALGCRRIVKREGGLVAITAKGCEAAGIPRIEPADIAPGDIAVGALGDTDWGVSSLGLIRTGLGYAALLKDRGMIIGPARIEAAWRV